MNAELKKLVVEKVNEIRKKNAETQVANIAAQIVQQLTYNENQTKQVEINIETYRKQIEALSGTIVQPMTAEEIFGKEGK